MRHTQTPLRAAESRNSSASQDADSKGATIGPTIRTQSVSESTRLIPDHYDIFRRLGEVDSGHEFDFATDFQLTTSVKGSVSILTVTKEFVIALNSEEGLYGAANASVSRDPTPSASVTVEITAHFGRAKPKKLGEISESIIVEASSGRILGGEVEISISMPAREISVSISKKVEAEPIWISEDPKVRVKYQGGVKLEGDKSYRKP